MPLGQDRTNVHPVAENFQPEPEVRYRVPDVVPVFQPKKSFALKTKNMLIDRFYLSRIFPEKEIASCWNEGFHVMSAAHGNGQWVLVAASESDLDGQQWNTDGDFPNSSINEGWKSGKDIIWISYGNGSWVVFMSGNTGYGDQVWRSSSRVPDQEITQGLNDG